MERSEKFVRIWKHRPLGSRSWKRWRRRVKLANRLLEQERNELEAERDRLRKALQVIASGHFIGMVELVNTEEMKTVWKSDVGLPMTVSEARDIARKALEGAKNE